MIALDSYPVRPGFKVRGPSAEAADSVRSDAAILRSRCLAELKREDLTADEVAARVGESILSVRPRISELVMRREVRDCGSRRRNISGKSATVWTAKMQAVQAELI
ncbi:MAG: hypothetical protein KGL39_60690 [Patescibacteria group bacterium]|nr:hypothetical protein [Patescibacteria group bacterium]